jgi:hypothetical protein
MPTARDGYRPWIVIAGALATMVGLVVGTPHTSLAETTTPGQATIDVVAAASPASTGGGRVGTASTWTFTKRTTDDSLGSNFVTGVYVMGSTVYASTTGGLSISTNGGANFTNYTTDDGLGGNNVQGVYAIGSKVYAATAPNTGGAGGVSISTNINATPAFTNYTTGLGDNFVQEVYAIDDAVYAATDGGLSISTNGGATFTNRTFLNSGLGSNIVFGVYADGGTVYAATFGGLSISTDGGANFTNYSLGNSDPNPVWGVFAVGGTVYAATQNYGLFIGSPPPLAALPVASSVVVGAAGTVTISSTAPALPDDTVITAVSADTGVATVISSVNASGGTAAFTVTGVTAGTTNVTFSATGYASVVVPVTVTALPSPPSPVFPPSAPGSVTGVAGDGSAVLSWTAPASSGSFSVSTYPAVVSPGGQSCLVAVPELTCTIGGLTDGASYTATVRALNGAGWSSYSAPSDAVTPSVPVATSILIAGSRVVGNSRRIEVEGNSTGLVGQQVTPWLRFPDETSFVAGVGVRTVDAEGKFTWSRRTAQRVAVYFAAGDITSDTVILRAR